MASLLKALPALVVIFLLSFPSEARADGIIINSGSLNMSGAAGGNFTFQGQGITLNGWIDFAPAFCAPCSPGQATSVSLYRTGGDVRGGSGIIDGVGYDHLFYESQVRFTSAQVIVPDTDAPDITLIVPFTFEANMQACAESTVAGPCPGGWVFSNTLSGQGLATLYLSSYSDGMGGRLYTIRSVSYNFQPPMATPEPATLLLLGTGLAGLAARYRKRRQK